MNPHYNLTAYEDYEIFIDENIEKSYKEKKLFECNEKTSFIKKLFEKEKLNVTELGSGNSKLLINLNQNKYLKFGHGFEISDSRNKFADKWIKDLNLCNIKNVKDNFLNLENYNLEKQDLFVCIDLAFQFLDPIKLNSDSELLKKIYNNLESEGKLILELDGCGKIIDSINFGGKIWEQFEEPDPWIYSLWECGYDKNTNFLDWKKIFISRKNFETSSSKITLKVYTKERIKKLLENAGFKKIIFFQNWKQDIFESDYSEFIVVAEK
jgi:hypothetical protein